MNIENYEKATKILNDIKAIKIEIDIWDKELTSSSKLAYLQGWNGNHPADLKSNIDKRLFESFRVQCTDNLKLKTIELQKELEDI